MVLIAAAHLKSQHDTSGWASTSDMFVISTMSVSETRKLFYRQNFGGT